MTLSAAEDSLDLLLDRVRAQLSEEHSLAVLIEAISVVVRLSDLRDRYPGGWEQFVKDAPSETLCADEHIARVGFNAPRDAEAFVAQLTRRGLAFPDDGGAADIAVINQGTGPTTPVEWLEFGIVPFLDGTITVARLVGDTENVLMTPDGWNYETSPSRSANDGVDDVH